MPNNASDLFETLRVYAAASPGTPSGTGRPGYHLRQPTLQSVSRYRPPQVTAFRPLSMLRDAGQSLVGYRQAMKEARSWLESAQRNLRRNYTVTSVWGREASSVEAWKAAKATREVLRSAYLALITLNRKPNAGAVRLPAGALSLAVRQDAPRFRSYRASRCPLCGETTIFRLGSVGGLAACEVCHQAGAVSYDDLVSDRTLWFPSAEAMERALNPQPVRVISNCRVQDAMMPAVNLSQMLRVAGLESPPVYYIPGEVINSYHQSSHKQLDASARRVGIEIELNKGKATPAQIEELAAQVVALSDNRLLAERDGSITGCELITGHGAPSTLRQVLAPVWAVAFSSPLVAVARTTGGHVHVTRDALLPEDARRSVWDTVTRLHELLSDRRAGKRYTESPVWKLYWQLAGRQPNKYCPAIISTEHRSGINVTPETVEFRAFKSQLRLARLLRNAEFALLLTGYAEDVGGENLQLPQLFEYLADKIPREDTLELRAWLAGRGHRVPHSRTQLTKAYQALGLKYAA